MFDDSNLWCEDCEHSNAGECNQHGPLLVVQDNVVQSRARQSLPHMLCIGPPTSESGADNQPIRDSDGPSVFSRELVRRRTRFGPLQAKELGSNPSQTTTIGSLEFGLFLEGREPVFLGRGENWEEYCNWMAMVRPARNAEEQNLVAFQYHAGIYFVTTRDIEPNTELRVWYAREYAYCMGTKPLKSIDCIEAEKERKDNGRKRDSQLGKLREMPTSQAVCSSRSQSGDSSKGNSPTKNYGYRGRSLRSEGRLQRLGEAMREWRESTTPRSRKGTSGRSEAPALRESPRRTAETPSGKSKKVVKNEENKSTKEMAGDWSLCGRLRSEARDAGQGLESKGSSDNAPQMVESKWRQSTDAETAGESGRETELPPNPIPSTSETTPKRHRCAICGKTFGSPGKLAQHSYSHTGERPFGCSDCPKAFSSKFKLERHKLIHTGERRHQCATCCRSFRRRDHLRNHERVHRTALGESVTPDVSAPPVSVASPVLRCDRPQCSREFRSAAAHGRHLAGHAAREGVLQCEVCGAGGFARASDVLRHLREVHVPQTRPSTSVGDPEEQRRFPCSDCGRTFFTRKDVRRHLVVHTGRRDFLCQFCPQRFGRKDHLIRHTKKGHGMDIESVGTSGGGETSGGAVTGMSDATLSTIPIMDSTSSLKGQQCSSTSPLPMSPVEFKTFASSSDLQPLRLEAISEGTRMYDEENRVDIEHLLSLIPPLPSSPSGSEPAALSQGHSPFSLRPPDRESPMLATHSLSLLSENVSGVAEQVIPQPESTPLPRFDQVFHPQQP
ncbi:PR domain zinc finger protein 10-like [Hetaerina americana]|uniref:PR domain zinc finger protein 10-like n=1 Tax=Hetaerina americana TaxID=62018 RepID=UPI003A7F22C2